MSVEYTTSEARLDRIAERAHDNHANSRREVAADTHFLYGIEGEKSVVNVANEMVHELEVLRFLLDNAEGGDEVARYEAKRATASAICDAAVVDF